MLVHTISLTNWGSLLQCYRTTGLCHHYSTSLQRVSKTQSNLFFPLPQPAKLETPRLQFHLQPMKIRMSYRAIATPVREDSSLLVLFYYHHPSVGRQHPLFPLIDTFPLNLMVHCFSCVLTSHLKVVTYKQSFPRSAWPVFGLQKEIVAKERHLEL